MTTTARETRKLPQDLVAFLKTDLWLLSEKELPRHKAIFVRMLKILLLAWRGFQRNRCSEKASALTFYSLLSVVPLVAVFFGIAKGFGFQRNLKAQLLAKFPAQTDVLAKVFEFADTLLLKTRGGVIAGVGVALLFWSVVKVLARIEDSFNHIWHVESPRSIGRKLSDYLSLTVVCPLLFVMSSSLTVTVAGRVKSVAKAAAAWGVPPAPVLALLGILPFVLIWALFTFVFVFMPNTKVRLRSGFLAALAAGSAYQLTQMVYIAFQVGVARANAIYGSFAALPLFLTWVQLSWLIVLLGCEISFSVQNVDSLGFPEGSEEVSAWQRKVLSLLVLRLVARNFAEGAAPLTPRAVEDVLGIPSPLVRRILSELRAAGLLSATLGEGDEEPAFQPARDIHDLRVWTALEALERSGSVELAFAPTVDVRAVSETLDAFARTVAQSAENRLVIDL
ncbi:MAG: YihY/virulence factor BrkB family protein [Verrucomicrobiota bacterium]